jgi:hypothetical protein
MSDDNKLTLADRVAAAVSSAINRLYDEVAVSKEEVLQAVQQYELGITTWEEYREKAPSDVMGEIADGYIQWTKIKVSGLGTVLGAGGAALLIPDTLQFVGFSLRMVTGIAAAYGFDPHPQCLEGRMKTITLQAYLNANLGKAAVTGVERVSISGVVKFLKTAAMRSHFLLRLIVLIGRLIGLRISRQLLLRAIPGVAAGINGMLSWYLARGIARNAKAEFRQFRRDIRHGKYKSDPDYAGI